MIAKLIKKYRELILYGILGAMGALTDFLVYLILVNLFHLHPTTASFLSVSAGIMVSFILNGRYNFKKTDRMWLRFATFYTVGLFGALLSVILLFVLFDLMNVNAIAAKLITIPPVVLAQFFINKRVSFSENPRNFWKVIARLIRAEWLVILVILVSGVLFFSSSNVTSSVDEMDNVLNGKLITEGHVPYRDFFSHHTPGMYYVSAAMRPFVAQDVANYRLVFTVITFILLLVGYVVTRKRISKNVALLFMLTMACAHTVALMNVGLAESLLALILPITTILIFFPSEKPAFSATTKICISCLLFFVPFLSLGYLFTILPLYILFFYRVVKEEAKDKRVRSFLWLLVASSLPYLCYLLYLLATNSFLNMYYDVLVFNMSIYAPYVGEASGGFIAAFISSIGSALTQMLTVVVNLFNPVYVFQAILLSGAIVFIGLTIKKKEYAAAITSIIVLLLSSTRVNKFNPPPIITSTADIMQHGAVYVSIVVLFGVIAYVSTLQNKRALLPARLAAICYLVVVPVVFASITIGDTWRSLTNNTLLTNYSSFINSVHESNKVRIINSVTDDNEYFWIAPQDFASQLFISSNNASRYKFYFPWLDSSSSIRAEVISDIRNNEPIVIYFEKDYYASIKNVELLRILESDYFRFSDSRLSNYYFIKASHNKIVKEMQSYGYKTD